MKLNSFRLTNHGFQVMDLLTGFCRRHPGGTQETPRRHAGAPEGIFLKNHHHSQTKCKKFPRLIMLQNVLKVRLGFIGICNQKCSPTAVNALPKTSRPLDTTPLEPLQLKIVWGTKSPSGLVPFPSFSERPI